MFDVSIIIPTFNRLWSLPKAIETCRDQGCKIQIVVIDDGSTDGTFEWLVTQTDVKAIQQDNWGKDWAVNAAFAHASGKYVRFLDSDDWYHPGVLVEQFRLAESEQADVVVGGYSVHDERGGRLRHVPWVFCDDFIAQQLGECDGSHYSAFLFRRNFIADIPHRPDYGLRDDRMFILEVAMRHPKISIFGDPVVAIRHHDQPRLQFPRGMRAVVMNFAHLAIYRHVLAALDHRGELTPRRKRAAAQILWPLAHWIAYTHPVEASEVVDWIYELDSDFSPPETGLLGKCYRHLGFRETERLLRQRRRILQLFALR